MATKTPKSGKITPENQKEARALKAIWDSDHGRSVRREAGHFTQEAFGQAYNIGNQAAVGFFLNGHTALSLKAAHGFARGLACRIADFSPRLAALVEPEPIAAPATAPKGIAPAGLDHAALEQLIRDLRAIPARRLGQLLDQIHQEAELAREAHEHLAKHPEPRTEIPSAAARRRHASKGGSSRLSVQVQLGDGNPRQGVLPLTTVPDPFTAEPSEREQALYERIAGHEKHPR